MGRFLPLYYGTMMGVSAILALGFWKLWNWTRVVVLVLIGVTLIAVVPEGIRIVHGGTPGVIALFLLRTQVHSNGYN